MCSGSEAGSYLRIIDCCITQLEAQGPSRTCNESEEEEGEDHVVSRRTLPFQVPREPRYPHGRGGVVGIQGRHGPATCVLHSAINSCIHPKRHCPIQETRIDCSMMHTCDGPWRPWIPTGGSCEEAGGASGWGASRIRLFAVRSTYPV